MKPLSSVPAAPPSSLSAASSPAHSSSEKQQIRTRFVRSLLFSQGMALIWWLVTLWLRGKGIPVWYDQIHIFRESVAHISDPFSVFGFYNPPWLTLLIAPFYLLPVEASMLLQTMLYFGLLTAVIFKFKGDWRAVALTLTTFIALDTVIEFNVDWVILIGLLVPVEFSAPFLILKPHITPGFYFGIHPRHWIKIGLVLLVTLGISFILWQGWISHYLAAPPTQIIGDGFNIAPSYLLSAPVSLLIGIGLAIWAFRRQDPPLGIVAWFFFTPYIKLYSLLLLFSIIAIRLPRLAAIITLAMWAVYGSVLLPLLLRG